MSYGRNGMLVPVAQAFWPQVQQVQGYPQNFDLLPPPPSMGAFPRRGMAMQLRNGRGVSQETVEELAGVYGSVSDALDVLNGDDDFGDVGADHSDVNDILGDLDDALVAGVTSFGEISFGDAEQRAKKKIRELEAENIELKAKAQGARNDRKRNKYQEKIAKNLAKIHELKGKLKDKKQEATGGGQASGGQAGPGFFQMAEVPPGGGELTILPMFPETALSAMFVGAVDDDHLVCTLTGATSETITLISPNLPSTEYQVVGLQCGFTARDAGTDWQMQSMKIDQGSNMLPVEAWQTITPYQSSYDRIPGLRAHDAVRSPNRVRLTVRAKGANTKVISGHVGLLVNVLRDTRPVASVGVQRAPARYINR